MTSIAIVASISAADNALASMCPPFCADIDVEEDVQAGNTTMMTNQTAGGNMTGTGTNSTT